MAREAKVGWRARRRDTASAVRRILGARFAALLALDTSIVARAVNIAVAAGAHALFSAQHDKLVSAARGALVSPFGASETFAVAAQAPFGACVEVAAYRAAIEARIFLEKWL